MPPRRNSLEAAAKALRAHALSYPETHEEFPWGERVVKVRGKVFVFMGHPAPGCFGMSVKLPRSGLAATALGFAQPTGYGLGKSGWVSARFDPGDEVPVDFLKEWIDESYRAIAPRRIVAHLDAARSTPPRRPTRKR
jgi:predicted DNA-binding protein (MmcQ/YjbR family)